MNHVFRSYFGNVCRWAVIGALASFQIASQAQTYKPTTGLGYSADATKFWMDLSANRVNIGMSPVAVYPTNVDTSKITFPSGSIQAGAAAVGSTSTGDTAMVGRVATKLANKDIVIDVEAKVVKSTLGPALARFAAKAIPGINTALAIGQFLGELDISVAPGVNGADNTFFKTTKSTQQQWVMTTLWSQRFGPADLSSVCSQAASYAAATYGLVLTPYTIIPEYGCEFDKIGRQSAYKVESDGGSIRIVTEAELADEIASKSGWPSSSMIKQALVDALKAGNQVATEPVTLKGPSSVPPTTDVEKSTRQEPAPTESNPNAQKTVETTKTTTTENPITYSSDKATVNPKITVTTTTKTTNPDGSVTTSTGTETTEVTKDPSTSEPETDFCAAHPEVLACIKLGQPPSPDHLDKSTKPFEMTAATFTDSATCPAPVTFSLSLAGVVGNYSIPYTPACEVMAMLRALVLAIAAFAAAYVLADSFKVS